MLSKLTPLMMIPSHLHPNATKESFVKGSVRVCLFACQLIHREANTKQQVTRTSANSHCLPSFKTAITSVVVRICFVSFLVFVQGFVKAKVTIICQSQRVPVDMAVPLGSENSEPREGRAALIRCLLTALSTEPSDKAFTHFKSGRGGE